MTFLRRCGAFIAEFSRSQNARQAPSSLSREFSWLSRPPVSNPKLSTDRLDSTFRQLQPSLVRPLLFCTAASGAAFVGAAAYARNHERDLWQERTHESRASSTTLLGRAKEAWQNLSMERKVIYGIVGINVGVFGLWRLPILQVAMSRWFLMAMPPLRMQPAFTALTCTFSHASLAHLAFNMIAFTSFGGNMSQVFGGEQFLFFFLTAGMVSSLTSYAGRLRSLKGGHSLGASGAVYACFAGMAILYPGASAQFIFLPGVPIQLGTLLPVLMGADALGALLGWRYLDHLGHLGGAVFGILYTLYGHHLWERREEILKAVGLVKDAEKALPDESG